MRANGLLRAPNVGMDDSESSFKIEILAAIQTASVDQIARTNDFIQKITSDLDQRRGQLESQFDERRRQLEDEVDQKAKIKEKEFEIKEIKIQAEKALLDEQKKELDDRSNTHARRAVRGELIQTLQSRQSDFSIAPGTNALRRPIHFIFLALLAFTAAGALWSAYIWGMDGGDSNNIRIITVAAKTIVFAFGFLTAAGLYISWMNRWFDKHAEVQFQTKQFEIDINRATWAVEAALEWKGIQGEQMPEALLSGITRHLFETHPNDSPEYSPLETPASGILGNASNLKMNVGGSEISLDRKGLNKVAKG